MRALNHALFRVQGNPTGERTRPGRALSAPSSSRPSWQILPAIAGWRVGSSPKARARWPGTGETDRLPTGNPKPENLTNDGRLRDFRDWIRLHANKMWTSDAPINTNRPIVLRLKSTVTLLEKKNNTARTNK